ncbi:Gfo/Idh/MocA family protein [Cohnella sp. GCM10027633]|uniref:Gfo/Idh/MocA family protein n=1 Tax=unclassified Cohnella TaxID=2636738 RepID=UPI00363BDBF7
MSGAVRFGIVGGGWRSEFYLRIAAALPERFEVGGIVVRNADKGAEMQRKWAIPAFRSIKELLAMTDLSFVVVSVPRTAAPYALLELSAAGMPALCETPPAETVEEMAKLFRSIGSQARIQVAEQYPYQPNHAARLAVARSGKLGRITLAEVSAAHDYHGIVLMRRFLGVGFDNASIRGMKFRSPIVEGRGRDGGPFERRITESEQTIAMFDFGDRLGMYDFTGDQYFSWIRSPRMLVRGDSGEIHNSDVRYLQDFRTPVETSLRRVHAGQDGNLEGFHLKTILCGEECVYRNEFAPGRLADDEIAIADCLARMANYSAGGPGFYSLAEASQDHYLGLVMQEAVKSGTTIVTHNQVWAE